MPAILRRQHCVGAGLLLCLAAAMPASAAPGDAPASSAPPASCALHAWPTHDFHTTYYGWTHGGTTDASLKGRKGYPPVVTDTLTAAQQLAALKATDLPKALGLSGYGTIVHAEALNTSAIRTVTGRHASDSGPCYAELLVESVALQEDYFSGKFLNVVYRLRRFHEQAAPDWAFGTFITTRIIAPLNGKDTVSPEILSARAAEAFGHSITAFGQIAQRAMARNDHKNTHKGEPK